MLLRTGDILRPPIAQERVQLVGDELVRLARLRSHRRRKLRTTACTSLAVQGRLHSSFYVEQNKVNLCADACSSVKADLAELEIAFGCDVGFVK